MATSKRVFSQVRHRFRIAVTHPITGKTEVMKFWAKVRLAKKPVTLTLKSDHIEKSMKLGGVGDTTTCSMAVCSIMHAKEFPHPVTGYIDWQYSRVFISSKNDARGVPVECVAYEHSNDIAHLNDDKGGQKKLLDMTKKDGPITIHLRPYRKRSKLGRPGKGRATTGKRAGTFKGAKLRQARAIASGAI
jgi:hypothetical protein